MPPSRASADLRVAEHDGQRSSSSPIKLPEIMSCLRIRQMTPFGNMHVKVSVEAGRPGASARSSPSSARAATWPTPTSRRSAASSACGCAPNGSLDARAAISSRGIGSSLTVPTKDGRILSLADGLARALTRYLEAKRQHGIEALLLGRADLDPEGPAPQRRAVSPRYRIQCPACSSDLAFEEGCAKCHACGFSQC